LTILAASPEELITRDHRQVHEENLPEVWEKEVRSTSQPDCNPLDYFVCGVFELLVDAQPHNKIEDLIQKMKAPLGPLDRDTVAKACYRFKSRIEAFVTDDSHFIE
jgi:hypothetical protein